MSTIAGKILESPAVSFYLGILRQMFKRLQAHWGRGSFSNYNYHLAEHSRATEQQATTTADSKPKAAMEQSKRQREQSKRQKAASQSSVYLATAIQR